MSWSFDGVDDVVASGAEVMSGGLISIIAWVKPIDITGTEYIFACGPGKNPLLDFGFNNVPANSFRVDTSGGWNSLINTVVLNQWQHLGMTYDGSLTANNPLFYVNGQPVTATRTAAPGAPFTPGTQVLYLGNASTVNRAAHGLIGEVAVWSRVLSAVDMNNLYILGAAAIPDYGWYFPGDAARIQQLPRGGPSLTNANGVVAGENPPVRPVGRRG